MVVTARPVHMTMREFFLAGRTHIGHFDVEVQGLPGQRMVTVDMHGLAIDLGHGHIDHALRTLTLELHAGLNVLHTLERFARQFLHQFRVMHAVAFGGCYIDFELIASDASCHHLLQTRHDLAGAMQIGERLTAFGTVDHLAAIVGQGVMERNTELEYI